MTAKEIRLINKKIIFLKSKVSRLETEAINVTPSLSLSPGKEESYDKIGNKVPEIVDLQKKIQNLEMVKNNALNNLSQDIFQENCLFMKYSLGYSWTKIACIIGGNNTGDGIRMACERYSW